MEKDKKKKLRRRNNIIKSLVLVIAFVVAVGGTFGMTMAYFGGKSTTQTQNMKLKAGIWIDSKELTTVEGTQFVVPSQIITPTCELTIKSSLTSGGTAVTGSSTTDQPSKGLLRAGIKFTAEATSTPITLSGGAASFEVKNGSGTKVGDFVKWGNANADGVVFYYFMPSGKTTLSDSGEGENDVMQVVDTSNGAVTYRFEPKITIPPELGNTDGGKTITLQVFYQVIQSELYTSAGAPMTNNVKTISALMDAMLGTSAEY